MVKHHLTKATSNNIKTILQSYYTAMQAYSKLIIKHGTHKNIHKSMEHIDDNINMLLDWSDKLAQK